MKTKLAIWLLATVGVFVPLANTAVIWHGALFIGLMPIYAYFVNKGFDWARSGK